MLSHQIMSVKNHMIDLCKQFISHPILMKSHYCVSPYFIGCMLHPNQ